MKNIDPKKKYRTVQGHYPARIICTDKKGHNSPIVVLADFGTYELVIELSQIGTDCLDDPFIEEVPETDWNKVQIDTLIWVGLYETYYPRYFAGYDPVKGQVKFFAEGCTSITTTRSPIYAHPSTCSLEKPQ